MTPSPHEVVVTEVGTGLAQEIRAGRHRSRADEPVPPAARTRAPIRMRCCSPPWARARR